MQPQQVAKGRQQLFSVDAQKVQGVDRTPYDSFEVYDTTGGTLLDEFHRILSELAVQAVSYSTLLHGRVQLHGCFSIRRSLPIVAVQNMFKAATVIGTLDYSGGPAFIKNEPLEGPFFYGHHDSTFPGAVGTKLNSSIVMFVGLTASIANGTVSLNDAERIREGLRIYYSGKLEVPYDQVPDTLILGGTQFLSSDQVNRYMPDGILFPSLTDLAAKDLDLLKLVDDYQTIELRHVDQVMSPYLSRISQQTESQSNGNPFSSVDIN